MMMMMYHGIMMLLMSLAWIQGASKGSKAFGKKLNVEARNRYKEPPAAQYGFPAARMATRDPPAAQLALQPPGWAGADVF
ncbi:hypothetical protein Tco_1127194 [Tanacetum coccineum]